MNGGRMQAAGSTLYTLVLSLWVGSMAGFTFVVTPAIFRSFARDRAGEIVGALFPGYFGSLIALSAVALALFFLLPADRRSLAGRVSLLLLCSALAANLAVSFKVYPDSVRVKQEVATFERDAPDSPARREFRRLHAVSAALNLFVLADGAVLLALSRRVFKE